MWPPSPTWIFSLSLSVDFDGSAADTLGRPANVPPHLSDDFLSVEVTQCLYAALLLDPCRLGDCSLLSGECDGVDI